MNNISSLLERLSLQLGVEIGYQQTKSDPERKIDIRFSGLPADKGFTLQLSRSWKTSRIVFLPDAFALHTLNYLAEQAEKKRLEIETQLESIKEVFSELMFEVNGFSFASDDRSEINKIFRFEVEVLTPESALREGLLNSREEEMLSFATRLFASLLPIERVEFRSPDEVIGFPEGAKIEVSVNKYERDHRNRKIAIELHGLDCAACGFNFEAFYGSFAEGYIVVHHVTPVSMIGPDYVVNPDRDLVTICANCHAMLHRADPPLTVAELLKIIENKSFE
jgi:5-methylcytosine-specific restriction protein A